MATGKLKKANYQINKLSKSLDDVSAYSPYIHFKIGKGVTEKNGERYTLEFDTLSGLGLNPDSYGDKNNQINYILEADVKKVGLNCGNTFKIRLAFVADYAGKENESLMDKLKRNRLVFKQFDESILFQQFELRYGYCFPQGEKYVKTNADQYILSPTYRGLIMNYTMEILNGYVMYELECVSGICTLTEITLDKSSEDLCKLVSKVNKSNKPGETYNPVLMVRGLLEEYIEVSKLKYKIIDNINDGDNPCGCEPDGGGIDGEHPIFAEGVHGEHIFDYIRRVLTQSRAKGQWNYEKQTPETEQSQIDEWTKDGKTIVSENEFIEFYFIIEDDVDGGELPRIILDYRPKKDENSKKEDDELDFDFEWLKGDKRGLVINFLPEFNGATFFALMGGTIAKINSVIGHIYKARYYNYIISNYGDFEKIKEEVNKSESLRTPKYGNIRDFEDVSSTNNYFIHPFANSEEYADYIFDEYAEPYNESGYNSGLTMEKMLELYGTESALNSSTQSATIQLVGIPSDIPLLTKIKITPIINNTKHFTAGMYQIIGIEDQISSSGFITTLKLFRSPDDINYKDMFDLYIESEYKNEFTQKELDYANQNKSFYDYYNDIYSTSDNDVYSNYPTVN